MQRTSRTCSAQGGGPLIPGAGESAAIRVPTSAAARRHVAEAAAERVAGLVMVIRASLRMWLALCRRHVSVRPLGVGT